MALPEEPESGGVPEWIVTFGDMMSLLLTFFIMLVSMSEIKGDEKYEALVEAMRRQFGDEPPQWSLILGDSRPRNSRLTRLATAGRARRLDTHKEGNKVKASDGVEKTVTIVRPGTRTAIGTVVFFPENDTELSAAAQNTLQQVVEVLQGKPQIIEVRGHTSQRPPDPAAGVSDNWQLAYLRARNTMQYLIKLGIAPTRIRISAAGDNEPLHVGTDLEKLKENGRVEVFLLDAVAPKLENAEAAKPPDNAIVPAARKAAPLDGPGRQP